LALLPALLHQAAFQGGILAWLASPARWLADFTWVSVLWAFMITLLLLPMFARLIYQTWTDKYPSPNEGEQPWA
jgi:predicted RND superfamily exporter protein